MKRIKQLLKNERFKNILLSIIMIFTLLYAFCCGFFIGTQKESIKQLDNYELVEKKDLNKTISKKNRLFPESNNFYTDLYFDYDYNLYIRADIYYAYSIDAITGDFLEIFTTIDLELTDLDSDYTYTNSFTFSAIPKINDTDFLNITNVIAVNFEYTLTNNSIYVLPQISCIIYYNNNNNVENELYFNGVASLYESLIINSGYQWDPRYVKGFTIYDTSFTLVNGLNGTYYNIGRDIGFNEGRDFGFNEGIEYQKEVYEQSDSIFDSIWDFLENAISTALSVFSIEILPGIPLSICIIIPLVFGIIFFIWKGGAQ